MRKLFKTLLTVVATLTFATGFSTKADASSNTANDFKSISQKFNTSISNLKTIDSLSNHIIYPYQTINKSVSSTETHTVQPGESLWLISLQYGVSVTDLKNWNNLSSENIYDGQVLQLTTESSKESVAKISSETVVNYSPMVVAEAKKHIGTPYVWGGSTPGGFDCSGFIYYVHNQAGVNISRTTAETYYNQSTKITHPEIGDLVFFENTYKSGISHMGIYVGNNAFIHASSSKGVQITDLSNPYWDGHFVGYGKF